MLLCPARAARILYDVSDALRRQAGGDPETWPLIVCSKGGPLSYSNYVQFLKAAVEAVGLCPKSIKGHSGRMWGCRALARRGVHVGAIQIFCRWGGATVLRYLQEAALEAQCGILSKDGERQVGSVALRAQTEEIVTKLVKHKKFVGMIAAAAYEGLSEKVELPKPSADPATPEGRGRSPPRPRRYAP